MKLELYEKLTPEERQWYESEKPNEKAFNLWFAVFTLFLCIILAVFSLVLADIEGGKFSENAIKMSEVIISIMNVLRVWFILYFIEEIFDSIALIALKKKLKKRARKRL